MTDSQPASRQLFFAIVSLTICAAIAALSVKWIADQQQEQIAANRLAWETRILSEVLPFSELDNEPWTDAIAINDEPLLGDAGVVNIYRARRNKEVIAVAITTMAPDGYVGPIKLLVGVSADFSVLQVRALEHRETPGLGDQIDRTRTKWVDQFAGLTKESSWQLQKDAGQIDQITGATVTSRSVTNAVRNALEYYRRNSISINTSPSGTVIYSN